MDSKRWFVYVILKGDKYYTGITTDLTHRMRQHGVTRPLYYEEASSGSDAARREKRIKGWSRAKKEKLWGKAE